MKTTTFEISNEDVEIVSSKALECVSEGIPVLVLLIGTFIKQSNDYLGREAFGEFGMASEMVLRLLSMTEYKIKKIIDNIKEVRKEVPKD